MSSGHQSAGSRMMPNYLVQLRSSIYWLGLVIVLLGSCKTARLPKTPTPSSALPIPPQPASLISIPVQVNLKPTYQAIEKSTPSVYAGGENPCEGIRYQYAFKRSPLRITGEGQVVKTQVNGEYSLSGSYCATCAFDRCIIKTPVFSCGVGEPLRKMAIAFETALTLRPDYQLSSYTTVTQLRPIDPCQISFLNVDISDALIKQIRQSIAPVCKSVDSTIAVYPMRTAVQEMWDKLKAPENIQSLGYFSMNPDALSVQSMQLSGDSLRFRLMIRCKPDFYLRRPASKSIPLPKATSLPATNGFQVFTDINLEYGPLTKLLNDSLRNKSMIIKGKKIVIDSVALSHIGAGYCLFNVHFSGFKKGVLYLTGKPIYEASTQTMRLQDLDYDLQTKSWLLKSASWIMDARIRENLTRSAVFPMKATLQEMQASLEASLQRTLTPDVRMRGRVQSCAIENIYPQPNAVVIRLQTIGSVSVQMY
ncbi:MAG: DUF4403 family protein [Ferruginibacter sp.]